MLGTEQLNQKKALESFPESQELKCMCPRAVACSTPQV